MFRFQQKNFKTHTANADFLRAIINEKGLAYFVEALYKKNSSGKTLYEAAHPDCKTGLNLLMEAATIYQVFRMNAEEAQPYFANFLARLNEFSKDNSSFTQFMHTQIIETIVKVTDGLFGAPSSQQPPDLRLAKKIHGVFKKYYPNHAAFVYANYLSRKEDQVSLFNAVRLYFKLYTKHSFDIDTTIFTKLCQRITHPQLMDEMKKITDNIYLFNKARYSRELYKIAYDRYNSLASNEERKQQVPELTALLMKAGLKGNAQAYLFLGQILENHGQQLEAIKHYEHAIAMGLNNTNKYLTQLNAQVVAMAKENLVAIAVETKKNHDATMQHLEKLKNKEKGKEKTNSEEHLNAPLTLNEQAAQTFARYYVNEDRALLEQLIDAGYHGEWIDEIETSSAEYLNIRAKLSATIHCELFKKIAENAKLSKFSSRLNQEIDFSSLNTDTKHICANVTQTPHNLWPSVPTHLPPLNNSAQVARLADTNHSLKSLSRSS